MKLKPKHSSLACYGVAGGLLVLSLTHLSTGIHAATGKEGEEWLSWATAIGIDAGLVGLELSTLASHQLVAFQRVKGLCRTGIVATLILSAGLNVMGFWQGAETTQGQFIAVILGCFVPGMVYALIQVANAQQTSSRVPAKSKAKKNAPDCKFNGWRWRDERAGYKHEGVERLTVRSAQSGRFSPRDTGKMWANGGGYSTAAEGD